MTPRNIYFDVLLFQRLESTQTMMRYMKMASFIFNLMTSHAFLLKYSKSLLIRNSVFLIKLAKFLYVLQDPIENKIKIKCSFSYVRFLFSYLPRYAFFIIRRFVKTQQKQF